MAQLILRTHTNIKNAKAKAKDKAKDKAIRYSDSVHQKI